MGFTPIALLSLAAFAVTAACADFQGAVAPDELNIKAAQPGTAVGATFEIAGSDEVWQAWSDAPRAAPGHSNTSCDALGNYSRTAGPNTIIEGPYHERCGEFVQDGDPEVIILTGIIANFVQPRSGNINLNFTVCGYLEDEVTGEWIQDCDAKAYVHYHHRHNLTEGAGVVLGTDVEGNDWLVFLGSVGHDGNEQLVAGKLEGVTAKRLDGSTKVRDAELTWEVEI